MLLLDALVVSIDRGLHIVGALPFREVTASIPSSKAGTQVAQVLAIATQCEATDQALLDK